MGGAGLGAGDVVLWILRPSSKQFEFLTVNCKCPGTCQVENSVLDFLTKHLDQLDTLWVSGGVKDRPDLTLWR